MDSNQTRYRALVTPEDWTARARSRDGQLVWNVGAAALTLRPYQYEFPPASAHPPAPDTPGRGGVFDRHGNAYALAADGRSIRVRSAGSGRDSLFWPVGEAGQAGVAAVQGLNTGRPARPAPPDDGGFRPAEVPPALEDLPLDALAVTTGHYLVAASAAAGGLLVFDLHGAGPPLLQPWPGLGRATALLALDGGGLGVLVGPVLHRTGPSLQPCLAGRPPAPSFHPEGTPGPDAPAPPPGPAPAPGTSACQLDLAPALPPGSRVTAVRQMAQGWLVLGRDPAQADAVVLGALGLNGQPLAVTDADASTAPEPPPAGPGLALGRLVQRASADRARPGARPLAGHALALCQLPARPGQADGDDAEDDVWSLFVLAAAGDQAFRFRLQWSGGRLQLRLRPEFWPMRRYDGGGLATLPAGVTLHGYPDVRVFYASASGWVPLLELPRPRHAVGDELTTPVWDGQAEGCVWHRLMLDARLPSGTEVQVYSRAVDGARTPEQAAALIEQAPWHAEPLLARHPRGSELPWAAAPQDDFATRDLLLQAAHGRWFQARLVLRGDGQRTPALRALRVWYPRFSYARQYLPAVYRDDPAGTDFLDRLLALFEGEFTRWEDRIAAAQLLVDARTAPADALDWLATWVALAFDPADSDPARRRLLLRHAVTGHARRGTVPGLLLAATLAWEPRPDEAWLRDPSTLAERPGGLRLQEFFGLVGPLPPGAWRPAQGREALLARLGGDASLLAGDEGGSAPLAERRRVLVGALGFVPRSASAEAALWAAWQAGRATATDATASADDPAATANPLAAPPDDEPADAASRAAWGAYLQASRACAPLRQRWQDFLVRRWRRLSALNAAWGTRWAGFDRVALPLALPAADAALADWHRFEAQVLRAAAAAHRLRIVLPLPEVVPDLDTLARRRAAVWRAVQREQPAHTLAEVRFGFELFRVGEARLGLDTLLHQGLARRPELARLGRQPILGRAELGQTRLEAGRPLPPPDRTGLDRGGAAHPSPAG